MKILHIVEDFSLNSGGLRTVIKNLDFQLKSVGYKSFILASNKEKEDDIFLVETNNKWLYSKKWIEVIDSIVNKHGIEIIHIHGVWMYPQYIAAKLCVSDKIPFVLSTHGMYEPWLWRKGTIKKKIYFNFLAKSLFSKASIIHSITPSETENLKKLFKTTSIIEIPNLIEDKNIGTYHSASNPEKYFLYLGRLDKKKGIDILINAFSKIENKNIKLKIAGKINGYKAELDKIISLKNIKDKIEFLGLVKGVKKKALIKNAIALVAPSHSEVIGMVNLEAAILAIPVITTYQTGLNKLWSKNGGKLINPNENEIYKALLEVVNWTLKERDANGKLLQKFVLKNYSWSSRLKDWQKLYQFVKESSNE